MKDVISVDTILARHKSAYAETDFSIDIRYGRTDAETKAELYSLLIYKLPEKHICTGECEINSNEWRIGHRAYKDAESNCIDDMHQVIDEMFGVK